MYLKPLINEVLNGRKTIEEIEKEIINNVENLPKERILYLIHELRPEFLDSIYEKVVVCKCCGNCCDHSNVTREVGTLTGFGYEESDIIKISNYRNMKPERFIRKYLSLTVIPNAPIIEGMKAVGYILKKRYSKPCIFRKKNKKCKIYPVRPINCQRYPLQPEVLYLDPLCEGYKETLHSFLLFVFLESRREFDLGKWE